MIGGGYIKLHRKMTRWEWYQEPNTFRLFIHLLLTVNYEDKKWQGKVIKRGQRVCSYPVLAGELKLSVMQIRTAIKKLKLTGEITVEITNEYSIISIVNYEWYQDEQQATQQSDNRQITVGQQSDNTYGRKIKKDKENKEYKEYKEIYKEKFDSFENEDLVKALMDFEQMRNKIKKPMTDRARVLLIDRLDKLAKTDEEKIELLNISILNSWQTVYPKKEEKRGIKNAENKKHFEELECTRF